MGLAIPAALGGARASASTLDGQGLAVSANPVTGIMDLFQVLPNGTVMYATYQAKGGWQPWLSLGGNFKGTVSAVSVISPARALNVFAVATNGNLEENSSITPGKWTGWRNLGGNLAGSPDALFVPGPHTFDVFGVTTAGELEVKNWQPHGGWQGWQGIGGPVSGTPSAIIDSASGNVEVYVAGGASGTAEESAYSQGHWTALRNLGQTGVAGNVSATFSYQLGQPQVYSIIGGQLAELSWTPRGGWSQASVGPRNYLAGTPSAFWDSVTGNVEVYAKGTDGECKGFAYTAAGWANVSNNLSGGVQIQSYPVPFATSGAVHVFAVYNGRPAERVWSTARTFFAWWRTVA
jgi:hypothetical protein